MNQDFLKDLNQEQKKAVLQTEGPIIILAGAGSGKTRVLTYKVIYLIKEKGIDPFNILMVTFTNKAANEMKERVQKFLINDQGLKTKNKPIIATFHALCAKILRVEGKYIGLPSQFAIYDTQDQVDAIKEAMERLNISIKDYKPSSILASISQAKNELISESEYSKYARGYFQEKVAMIYPIYQKILSENHALDFDDLLCKTVFLFENNPDILTKYQNRFKYILIDEYQDTNRAQYILTRKLARKWKNICVVGDFSQSIYSWRGADFTNLSRFKDDFANTKTFALSQNYRSTQKILDSASSVISKNTTHPVLKLWTENSEGEEVSVFEARNEQQEVEFIVNKILEYKLKFSDVAILYRTNAQSRVLEEVLLHNSIPYALIGGTRFYERKEIKDILAYLRNLDNKNDKISLKRIEKIGKRKMEKFLQFREKFDENDNSCTLDILDNVIRQTEYLKLYDESDEDDRDRLENIKELRSVALKFTNLTNFLENVSLVEQEYPSSSLRAGMPDGSSDGEKKNAVTLMTLHAAKGLEFPYVFIVGMEEGIFPHSRSLMDKHALEEERRLCYVGMTRAKTRLFLSYARKRIFFGQKTSNIISRFILEMPKNVIEKNIQLAQDRQYTI